MRRMNRIGAETAGVPALARRIGRGELRRLFVRFCHEVARFPGEFEIETAPFDLTLRDLASGFSVTVAPHRELFLVSIGESRSFDVRVSSTDSFVSALDLTLAGYLTAAAKPAQDI
jgi:hypothetical protein